MTGRHSYAQSIAAWLTLFSLLMFAAAIGFGPHVLRMRLASEREESRLSLERLDTSIRRNTQSELASTGARPLDEASMVIGGARGTAGAALLELLSDMMRRHNGRADLMEVMPANVDGARLVTARVSALLSNQSLRDFLVELETRLPFLFVDQVSIESTDSIEPTAKPVSDPPLAVDIRISAAYGGTRTP